MDAKKFWRHALLINDDSSFNNCALELFKYQSNAIPVYKHYLDLLKCIPGNVKNVNEIPFLPVQFFKSHIISDQKQQPEFIFTSSGTTGQQVSRHFVADLEIYNESLLEGFRHFYGEPSQYCILALLPTYLEREGSSLIYMVDLLIKKSSHPESGFYLHNYQELSEKLKSLRKKNVKIFLLGVSYALLDMFNEFPVNLNDAIIMETGGMKGKRKELIRTELHQILNSKSETNYIHSEYGMTELLSQAYSKQDGYFNCPPWMKVFISDLHDPFNFVEKGTTGIVNVIDLANIHSCAFIATQDLGRCNLNNSFEILGRMDSSELRGCNLMIA